MAHMTRLVPAMFLFFGPMRARTVDGVASPLTSSFLLGLAADRRQAVRRLSIMGEIIESAAKAGREAAQRAASARRAAAELAASAAARNAAVMLASQEVTEQLARTLVDKATEAAKAAEMRGRGLSQL